MSAAQTPQPVTAAENRRRWQAVGVGLVAAFMTLLDVSIVNVAVPSIDRALHASPSDLQWILSGYALTFGLALVPPAASATHAAGATRSSSASHSSP